jgi:hypothetical protein
VNPLHSREGHSGGPAHRGVVPEVAVIARVWQRLGGLHLVLWFVDRWVRKVIPLRILVVVTHAIDGVKPVAVQNGKNVVAHFLTSQGVRDCAGEGGRWFSPAFASEALSRGDRCFGVFEGERLLYCGWYSNRPTPALSDLLVSVGPGYLYSYKAHTHAEHRGRGLHRYGVAAAAAQLAAEGETRGIVAYIEASNVSSLLSSRTLGDEFLGFVVLSTIAGATRSVVTPACRRVGFTIHHQTQMPGSLDLVDEAPNLPL